MSVEAYKLEVEGQVNDDVLAALDRVLELCNRLDGLRLVLRTTAARLDRHIAGCRECPTRKRGCDQFDRLRRDLAVYRRDETDLAARLRRAGT